MAGLQTVLEIDLDSFQIRKHGALIRLTSIELNLLRVLIQHKNQTVTYKNLLKAVWGDAYGKESNYLHTYIGRLRKKLGVTSSDPQYLLTMPKHGYQWVEQEVVQAPSQLTGQHGAYMALPASLTSFIGREKELVVLDRMLRKRDVRLITLSGPGGIGKTRLSLEVARHLASAQYFPDGIYFVALETVDSADYVVSAITQKFGIREKAGEDLLVALTIALREKQLLLILDNFEHVHAAAGQILEILTAAPTVKIVVTSREPLGLYGEHQFDVPPLAVTPSAHSSHADGVSLSDAVQLFVDRAQALHPYFEITAENAATVQQICDRVDGLPLAIELAAVQSKRFAPHELLTQLNNQLAVLVGGQANLPARHQTVRAAIDWSYQQLDARERKLFVALSVFNGSFTPDAVAAVYITDPQDNQRLAQLLSALQTKSLLTAQWTSDGSEPRYTMLGAFREYAHELIDQQDAANVGRRHAMYYLQRLERAPEQGYEQVASDLGNLRAALNWAIAANEGELALRFGVGLHELWLRLGQLREGKQRIFDVLRVTEHHTSALRARALHCAGVIADWLGEPLTAQGAYRESLRLYEALNDTVGSTSALLTLASALINQGDYAEGQSLAEHALAIAREQNNLPVIAVTLNNLGMIAIYQGDAPKAQQLYGETLSLWQSMENSQGMGWAFTGWSWIELLRGNYEAAQAYVNQSLALHYQASDMLSASLALVCDSWIALYRADMDVAAGKLAACLAMCSEFGIVQLSLWPLVGLGLIALHRGDYRQAQILFETAHDRCKQLNFPPMTTWVYIALGKLNRLEGNADTAFDYLDRGLMLSHKRDDKSAMITALEEFAAYFFSQSMFESSAQFYGAAEAQRETYELPLPLFNRIEYDDITGRLKARAKADWTVWRQTGRALSWNEIVQVIFPRGARFENDAAD